MKYLYPAVQPGFMVYSDEHIFVRMFKHEGRFRVDNTAPGYPVFTKLFGTHLAASRYAERIVKASLKSRQQEDPLRWMSGVKVDEAQKLKEFWSAYYATDEVPMVDPKTTMRS